MVAMWLLALAAADPVAIPAGEAHLGESIQPDNPPRQESLEAFSIDRTEVSVDAFEAFAAEGYESPELWSEAGRAWLEENPQGAGAAHRAAGRSGEHPVVAVTFYEAEAYCASQGGRLPTEWEWERAACGGLDQTWPWGDESSVDAEWYDLGKTGHIDAVSTAGVASQQPALRSPEGLHHMAGNVWEWTASDYDDAGNWSVLRGGSYMNLPSYCHCSHREPARPERVAYTAGFRCAY